jgi:hypothetical protein
MVGKNMVNKVKWMMVCLIIGMGVGGVNGMKRKLHEGDFRFTEEFRASLKRFGDRLNDSLALREEGCSALGKVRELISEGNMEEVEAIVSKSKIGVVSYLAEKKIYDGFGDPRKDGRKSIMKMLLVRALMEKGHENESLDIGGEMMKSLLREPGIRDVVSDVVREGSLKKCNPNRVNELYFFAILALQDQVTAGLIVDQPLIAAINAGYHDVVEVLVEKGFARGRMYGLVALANDNGYRDIVKIFLNRMNLRSRRVRAMLKRLGVITSLTRTKKSFDLRKLETEEEKEIARKKRRFKKKKSKKQKDKLPRINFNRHSNFDRDEDEDDEIVVYRDSKEDKFPKL